MYKCALIYAELMPKKTWYSFFSTTGDFARLKTQRENRKNLFSFSGQRVKENGTESSTREDMMTSFIVILLIVVAAY